MGTDTPLAVLSNKPQLLYNYFKQLFAQVTNPPIDRIREEIITSTETMLGSEGNLLKPTPESCRMIKLKHPILTNEELEKLRHVDRPGFKAGHAADPVQGGRRRAGSGKRAGPNCSPQADQAIADGANIIILSDRGMNAEHAPHPRAAGGGGPASSSHPRRARARASAWCSNRANRARCITLRC